MPTPLMLYMDDWLLWIDLCFDDLIVQIMDIMV